MSKKVLLIIGIVILAIALTGIFGYLWLQKQGTFVSNQPSITPTTTSSSSPSAKVAAPHPEALTFDLPFTDKTIRLTRSASGKAENTFWGAIIATVNVNGDVSPLYNREDQGVSLFFDTPKNGFYYLYPGGYEKFSIVNAAYISSTARKTENIKDEMTNTSLMTACKEETITVGNMKNAKQVACTTTTFNNETQQQTDQNTLTTCFLPIANTNDFLADELPLRPAGTTANLCDTLTQIGIQSVTELANN